VRFDGVALGADAVLGGAGGGAPSVDRQLDVAIALTVAESVGAMRRLAEITIDYTKARTAFGRPIGSFQALKHLLADASLAVELSTAGAWAAAQAVAENRPTASEIASIAKAYVGDAGIEVALACLQAHGGIGFTWEHDVHFYLRRLTADRVLYGDPAWHRERICRIHGLKAEKGRSR
jgi:alkylation response protein AidB-like acyl-CoA dehydrogenase